MRCFEIAEPSAGVSQPTLLTSGRQIYRATRPPHSASATNDSRQNQKLNRRAEAGVDFDHLCGTHCGASHCTGERTGCQPLDPDPFPNHMPDNRGHPIPFSIAGIDGAGKGGVRVPARWNRNIDRIRNTGFD